MKFDLAFTLLDLGVPWYKTAASEMIRSARRAYKDHDMRVVQLTDNRSARHPDADGGFILDTDVKGNQLAQGKGHLMAEFALQADRPVVFCDVDLIWNNDGIVEDLVNIEDVACLWREDMPCMPFNTGLVLTPPQQDEFWDVYRSACETLPPEMCAWWGDQVAMTAANLITRQHVTRMDMDVMAPAITELPDAPLDTPAVHFKGDTKNLMIPYARMLDGGNVYDFARPNVTVEVDFGGPKQASGFTF